MNRRGIGARGGVAPAQNNGARGLLVCHIDQCPAKIGIEPRDLAHDAWRVGAEILLKHRAVLIDLKSHDARGAIGRRPGDQGKAAGHAAFLDIAWVSVIDNFLKPWLVGRGVHMPMSLTILGVFGGFMTFGFLGLFLGPTLIAAALVLLQSWRAERPARGQPDI
jgi:AI-2E family transporter